MNDEFAAQRVPPEELPGYKGSIHQIPYAEGSLVKAKLCHGAYRLPAGLNEGDDVKVVAIAIGVVEVEKDGQRYRVSDTCVDSGWSRSATLSINEYRWRLRRRLARSRQ